MLCLLQLLLNTLFKSLEEIPEVKTLATRITKSKNLKEVFCKVYAIAAFKRLNNATNRHLHFFHRKNSHQILTSRHGLVHSVIVVLEVHDVERNSEIEIKVRVHFFLSFLDLFNFQLRTSKSGNVSQAAILLNEIYLNTFSKSSLS